MISPGFPWAELCCGGLGAVVWRLAVGEDLLRSMRARLEVSKFMA